MTKRSFPKGFLWGAATAAHQVEGGLINDWTAWEQANAKVLAALAETRFGGLPNWPQIKAEATKPANYLSGPAADFRHRYPADIKLMVKLGLNAFRFSIDWSRLEPQPGRYDEAEFSYYRDLIKQLHSAGVEPLLTLWHWPLPQWLVDQGGWHSRSILGHWQRFVIKVIKELGAGITYWLTLNEPDGWAGNAYLLKTWPPQGPRRYLPRVLRQLVKAHRLAYSQIKQNFPEAQVGLAKSVVYFEPVDRKLRNRLYKRLVTWLVNYRFLNQTHEYLDFIGVNYYFHNRLDFRWRDFKQMWRGNFGSHNRNQQISDMGWELYPRGLAPLLAELNKYRKPLIITEHGLADASDQHRGWYIKESLSSVAKAIAAGADVRGYLHWSLIDNFEWDKGFWPRFGLAEVDFRTQQRRLRPSAFIYAQIIKSAKAG
ncbi:glycoside hydrolase family 1 protein [Candidatus Microgenomates bacterium]|nr:glycoside hydrolase family 1 protein [Candidatus Microgenomates bacterium]